MSQISAKVSRLDMEKIDTLVEKGCFMNRADFTRTAIREFLSQFPSLEEATKRTGETE